MEKKGEKKNSNANPRETNPMIHQKMRSNKKGRRTQGT
jgi:hypothetical protein